MGDVAGAGRDFDRAFELASAVPAALVTGGSVRSSQRPSASSSKTIVDYSVVGKDSAAALEWAVRARTATPRGVEGAGDAITLVLFVLPDRLMRWRVQGDSITTSEYRIERRSLIDRIDRFRKAIVQVRDLEAIERRQTRSSKLPWHPFVRISLPGSPSTSRRMVFS
jgi:hypothetical protein